MFLPDDTCKIPEMNTTPLFLTPLEVATRLQLNLLTIYGYIRTKQIRAAKFGRKYRIENDDLERFISQHRTFWYDKNEDRYKSNFDSLYHPDYI